MVTREYPYSDALMLAGGKAIAANLRYCIKELSEIRSLWTRGYITSLDSRLDDAFTEILGFSLPEIHQFIKFDIYDSLQKVAFDLSCLKIQIEVDFQRNAQKKSGYLTMLGFNLYPQKISSLSEEERIAVLEHFATNLTVDIRNKLVSNGVNPDLLDRLTSQAKVLDEMKQVQATLMLPNRELSELQVATLCSLYNEVIGICTIASTFFEKKSKKCELFTFSVVIDKLKGLCGESRLKI